MLTPDFKPTPFWWERTPRPQLPTPALPKTAEVLIIGSGYTGLSAAIQTARAGRHTVVIDAEDAGWGCSSRNGGQVSTSLKPTFADLTKRFNGDTTRALAVLQEGNNALAWIETFIRQEKIACDFTKVGRFHGAHSRSAFRALSAKIAAIPPQLNINAQIIPRARQHEEIATDRYHGGALYPHHASLDPARYHQGLLTTARTAGVEIIPHCQATAIKNRANQFHTTTTLGEIRATDIILATSGYTRALTPWQRRRIIPIGSYIIATEPLPPATLAALLPTRRVITDTRKLVVYYRTCPQRQRLLFGGRVSLRETDLRKSARRLHAQMTTIFPQLQTVRISHSWMGLVGFTFDALPHLGKQNGIYYSMGYCGSGISLSSYFGMRIAQQLLADPKTPGTTALNNLPFPSRPYYHGNPWFLAPSIFYYRWRDRLSH